MTHISTFVRADRLWLSSLFQAKNQPNRFYLEGVFIHSAEGGVCLAATDGIVLGVFLDCEGFTKKDCIVQMPKEALSIIKSHKNRDRLWFGIVGNNQGFGRAEACIFDDHHSIILNNEMIQKSMLDIKNFGIIWSGVIDIVDGSFPEYGRVIPKKRNRLSYSAFINPVTLKPFIDVASDRNHFSALKEPTGNLKFYYGEKSTDEILVHCGRNDFVGVIAHCITKNEEQQDEIFETPLWALQRRTDLVTLCESENVA
jgi:hypothetical protein